MVKVALVPCDDYAQAADAVETAIDLVGGVETLINKEEKLLLKPNLLAKTPVEKACTTHPAVFGGVAKYLLAHG